MVKFVCVLKSGGDYTPDYVNKLAKQLHLPLVCFTDFDANLFECETTPLIHGLPHWWSKVEAFRLTGRVIYLDLDTFVFGNLLSLMGSLHQPCFKMLTPFARSEKWASGVMAWNGDFSWLSSDVSEDSQRKYKWDQRYISTMLLDAGVAITPIQDHADVKSYKHHGKEQRPQADILCFHGLPRPHQAKGWAKQYWDSL